ncbi:MAG: hypothetical protein JWL60_1881 [Gemmatimonadetes bacterium]|jgi:copper chaperone|nr:hypothetical protein [Gemmatimonadota bacterium]
MLTTLRIDGMTCQRCVQAVFTALTPVDGIASAEVQIGAAVIEHDGRATPAALREAIGVAGYAARVVEEQRRRLPIL